MTKPIGTRYVFGDLRVGRFYLLNGKKVKFLTEQRSMCEIAMKSFMEYSFGVSCGLCNDENCCHRTRVFGFNEVSDITDLDGNRVMKEQLE